MIRGFKRLSFLMTDNKQSKLYLENFIQRYIDENNEYNKRVLFHLQACLYNENNASGDWTTVQFMRRSEACSNDVRVDYSRHPRNKPNLCENIKF